MENGAVNKWSEGAAIPAETGPRDRARAMRAPSCPERSRRAITHSLLPKNSISNRELQLLERTLTHTKQRIATLSNRELCTVCCRSDCNEGPGFGALRLSFAAHFAAPPRKHSEKFLSRHSPLATDHSFPSLLPGTAQQVEIAVTLRKQRVGYQSTRDHNTTISRAEKRTKS